MVNVKLALDSIRRPVSFDGHGYIVDRENERVAEVRGWGRISYMDRPEERQDSIGEMIAKLINEASVPVAPAEDELKNAMRVVLLAGHAIVVNGITLHGVFDE